MSGDARAIDPVTRVRFGDCGARVTELRRGRDAGTLVKKNKSITQQAD